MKIAVPVKDKTLTMFNNAGHTPYFAVFTVKGGGMFKAFELQDLRPNPRTDLEEEAHEEEEEGHTCSHDHDDEAHVQEHMKMGKALEDCDYLVVKRGCKNTARAMAEHGVGIKKYNGTQAVAGAILSEISAQLT